MPNPQSFKPNMGLKNNIRFTLDMLLDCGRVALEGCQEYFELWFEVKIHAQEVAAKNRTIPFQEVEDNFPIMSIILASTNSYDNVMARPRVR